MAEERIIIPFVPREYQAQSLDHFRRFNVSVCHRRFGKTVEAVNWLIKEMFNCAHPRPRAAYIAPMYRQAKQTAWDYAKLYTAPFGRNRRVFESELRIDIFDEYRLQLFGSDNPDAIRGIYLDAAVLDECAQMDPRLWPEVIRPTLSDRAGKALFIGTPQGRNMFCQLYEHAVTGNDPEWYGEMFRASETGILPASELESARRTMSPAQYAQEYECSFTAAIKGAYYADLLTEAEDEGRICQLPVNKSVPVETWWDLGVGDKTAIWFVQRNGPWRDVIDFYQNDGKGTAHYAKILDDKRREKGWLYSQFVFPHDVNKRESITMSDAEEPRTVLSSYDSLGLRPYTVIPAISIVDGVEAVRRMLPSCRFDREHTAEGLECLRQHREEWDERKQAPKGHPLHDWTSDAADAFRIGAMYRPSPGSWDRPIVYPHDHVSQVTI